MQGQIASQARVSKYTWPIDALLGSLVILVSTLTAPGIAAEENRGQRGQTDAIGSRDEKTLSRMLERVASDRERVQALGLACYLVPERVAVHPDDGVRLNMLVRNAGSDRVRLWEFGPRLDFVVIVAPHQAGHIRRTALGERIRSGPRVGSSAFVPIDAGQNRLYSLGLGDLFELNEGQYTISVLRSVMVGNGLDDRVLLASNEITVDVSRRHTAKTKKRESSPGGTSVSTDPSADERAPELPFEYAAAAETVGLTEQQHAQIAAAYQQYKKAQREAADRVRPANRKLRKARGQRDKQAISAAQAELDDALAYQRSVPAEFRKSIWATLNPDQVLLWERASLATRIRKIYERVGLKKEQSVELDKLIGEAAERVVQADPGDYHTYVQIRLDLEFAIHREVLTEGQQQILESK